MDQEKILSKFEELELYLEELEQIKPNNFKEYESSIEKKRSCERLLQISIESVLDICNILVTKLRIGIPSDEDDLFEKLGNKKVISKKMIKILKEMKGFRNILVHRYGKIEDERVFEILSEKLGDFDKFREEIADFLKLH